MVSTLWFWGWFLVSGTFFLPQFFQKNYWRVQESHIFSLFWSEKWIARIIFGMFFTKSKFFPESITYTNFLWPGNRRSLKTNMTYFCFSTQERTSWNSEMIHFRKLRIDPKKLPVEVIWPNLPEFLVEVFPPHGQARSRPSIHHDPNGFLQLCVWISNYKIWNAAQMA